MGYLQDLGHGISQTWKGITGQSAADAANQGAAIQGKYGWDAFNLLRGDIAPLRESLSTSLPLLQNFITNPGSIMEDPMLKGAVDKASQDTLAAQAAVGRVGAGDTRSALFSSIFPMIQNFRNQRFGELFNFANLGANATTMGGQSGADIMTQIGNSQAAGLMGAANARQQGIGNLIGIGGLAAHFLSDRRFKRDIKKIGEIGEIGIYEFRYKGVDDDTKHVGVMAQEVAKKYPKAVVEHDDVMFIDYEQLNDELGGKLYGT